MLINNLLINQDEPPLIIAEMSGNHLGEIERAFKLMDAVKKAGGKVIKLQTYTADTITLNVMNKDFLIDGGLWGGRNLYELYKEAHTPWEWHADLFSYANELGLTIFSSPFDSTAIDFLEKLDCPAYKIASFEVVDLPLIDLVARTGKPMIVSTGIASKKEIFDAVDAAKKGGCKELVLMHCVSGYPTPASDLNLKTIIDLKREFNVIVGLSDHTLGSTAAITSVALGAKVIEKHITLNRKDGGPDSAFSLEPTEFKTLVEECDIAWESLGDVSYSIKNSEKDNIKFRRSIYFVEDVKKGQLLTKENIKSIRPGYGLAPKYYSQVLGKIANQDVTKGTALTWEYFHS